MTVSSYFDYGATHPMPLPVRKKFFEALAVTGNPASQHSHGQQARDMLESAREKIAACLRVTPAEVVLTSGGTEAINLALKGFYWQRNAGNKRRPVILVAEGEHHATIDTVEWLSTAQGAIPVWMPLDSAGVLQPEVLEKSIIQAGADKIALVSVVLVNNEIGTVQPFQELSAVANKYGIPLHYDAVAALGQIPISRLEAACYSISAHKIGGPVSSGALILGRSHTPTALIHGGTQQRARSGTQDAAIATAFAHALELATDNLHSSQQRMSEIQQRILTGIESMQLGVVLRGSAPQIFDAGHKNGDAVIPARVFGNLHFTFTGCQGDSLLFLLDQHGISVATGSACTAGVVEISHVMTAIGLSDEVAVGALRISFSAETSDADVQRLLDALPVAVSAARRAGIS